MSTTTDSLPEYAVTVAERGDPQPVIDELTEWLDGQSAPEIVRWALTRGGSEADQPAEDEPESSEPEFTEPAEDETDEGAEDG